MSEAVLFLVTLAAGLSSPVAAQSTANTPLSLHPTQDHATKADENGPSPTPAAAPANPFKGAYLFGDWGGARLKMARKGVNFDVIFTQFGEGLTGSTKDAGFSYANKFDLFLNVDTAKASLWKGGGIGTHAEIRYVFWTS
jgi:carbohydrate-selective porin OprB